MRLICALLLTTALLLGAAVPVCALPSESPPAVPLSAHSAALILADTGELIYEKNADEPMGMASTTKLMTALVVAERCDPERIVSIPAEAVGIEGSSVYLTKGERLTVKELLYALLLSSANDASVALALTVSSSVEEFCALMNQRARELGLSQTHFVNPHGLYHREHYTTARELAILASAVLAVPLLRQIVSTKKISISLDGRPDQRLLVNHNRLLSSYEGALGMKTGYTKKTGRALVSAAERNGLTLIAVTLNAPDDWKDHELLLDYGFANYEMVTLAEAGTFRYPMPLAGGTSDWILLTNGISVKMALPRKRGPITYRIDATSPFLFAPQAKNRRVATLTYFCQGRSVSSPLYTLTAAEGKP